jgi:hypothetical protein
MQSSRVVISRINRDLKEGHKVFATPLLLIMVILTALLAYISPLAANHNVVNLHHIPDLLLWLILGLAGFFMPVFTRLQQNKLRLSSRIRATAAVLEAWKKAVAAAVQSLQSRLAAELATAIAVQPRRCAEIFEVSGTPHLCLTPRVLAQRPLQTRVPRG